MKPWQIMMAGSWTAALLAALFILCDASAPRKNTLAPAETDHNTQSISLVRFFEKRELITQSVTDIKLAALQFLEPVTPATRRRFLFERMDEKFAEHICLIDYVNIALSLFAYQQSDTDTNTDKGVFLNGIGVFKPTKKTGYEAAWMYQCSCDALIQAADILTAENVRDVAQFSGMLFRNYDFVARITDFSLLTPELVRDVTDPRDYFSLLEFPHALKTLQTKTLLAVLNQVEFELTEVEAERLVESRGLLTLMRDTAFIPNYRGVQFLAAFYPQHIVEDDKATGLLRAFYGAGLCDAPPLQAGETMYMRAAARTQLLISAIRKRWSASMIYDVLRHLLYSERQMKDIFCDMASIYRSSDGQQPVEHLQAALFGLLTGRKELIEAVKAVKTYDDLHTKTLLLLELMQVPLVPLACDSLKNALDASPTHTHLAPSYHGRPSSRRVWTALWQQVMIDDFPMPYDRELVAKYASPNQHRVLEAWMELTKDSVRFYAGDAAIKLLALVTRGAKREEHAEELPLLSVVLAEGYTLRCLPTWVAPYLQERWPEDESVQALSTPNDAVERARRGFKARLQSMAKEIVDGDNFKKDKKSPAAWERQWTRLLKLQCHLRQLSTDQLVQFMHSELEGDAAKVICDLYPFLPGVEVLRGLAACEKGREFLLRQHKFLHSQPSYAGVDLSSLNMSYDSVQIGLHTVPKEAVLQYLVEQRFLINDPVALVNNLHSRAVLDRDWAEDAAELFFICAWDCMENDPTGRVLRAISGLPDALNRLAIGDAITLVTKWTIGWECALYRVCLKCTTDVKIEVYRKLLRAECTIREGLIAHMQSWLETGAMSDNDKSDISRLIRIIEAGPASVARMENLTAYLSRAEYSYSGTRQQKKDHIHKNFWAETKLATIHSSWPEFCVTVADNMEFLLAILDRRLETERERHVWRCRGKITSLLDSAVLRDKKRINEAIGWITTTIDQATVPCYDAISMDKIRKRLNDAIKVLDARKKKLTDGRC